MSYKDIHEAEDVLELFEEEDILADELEYINYTGDAGSTVAGKYSSDRRRNEKPSKGKHNKKKGGKTKLGRFWRKTSLPVKIIIILVLILVFLAAAILITWYTLTAMGKKNLYGKVAGQKPSLERTIDVSQLEAFPTQADGMEVEGLQENNEAEGDAADGFAVIESSVPETDRVTQGDREGEVIWHGKKYVYNENILTFLVMGIDTMNAATAGGQSDANFLVVLNPDTRTVQIIAVNRDTITDIDYYYSNNTYAYTRRGHLCIQHGYGATKEESAQLQVKAVSRLMYDLPIHGYAAINMSAVPDINDAIGGVTVECLEDMSDLHSELTVGNVVTLKGQVAFDYVHWRRMDFESARRRLARQKQYITAYVNRAKEVVASNPSIVINLYNKLMASMTTDISIDKAAYLVSTALGYSFNSNNIITLEGTTRTGSTYIDISGNEQQYDEFYPDEEKLKQLIVQIFYKEAGQ